jgi:hypothetical protein
MKMAFSKAIKQDLNIGPDTHVVVVAEFDVDFFRSVTQSTTR